MRKNKWIWFILGIWPFFLKIGCRKACYQVSIPPIRCEEDYSQITDIKLYNDLVQNKGPYRKFNVIETLSEFDSIFNKHPHDSIDFAKYSLLSAHVTTDLANGVKWQYYVCKHHNSNSIIFTIKYSLDGQCQGSGIGNLHKSFWIRVPKVSSKKDVEFQIIDVNPFQY